MSRIRNKTNKFLSSCSLALVVCVPLAGAYASSFDVLYAFKVGNDGALPYGGLIEDNAGNLYGTTVVAGTGGAGAVFKLAPNGTETVLYAFKGGNDGESPYSGLIMDESGNLYGTTEAGGTGKCSASGCGTVFKVTPGGKETVLYSFKGGADGQFPYSGLVADAEGNLYGTTNQGGGSGCLDGVGCGTVFKLASDGTETVLYAFQGSSDGENPYAGLIMDNSGNLYGTTTGGGADGDYGTVFKVAPNGAETVLHSFAGSDGEFPIAGLIADQNGNLYGTAEFGGVDKDGTAFELATDGTLTVLHAFGAAKDGSRPVGGLVADTSGNFYGTTVLGGAHASDRGTVFKLAPSGTETILHSFDCKTDGCNPQDGVIADSAGNLYGTDVYATKKQGVSCGRKSPNCGTVFKLRE